jgi:hypothetical protein
LFDIPIMPWEPDGLYRTRLKATIAASSGRGDARRSGIRAGKILNGVVESLVWRTWIIRQPQVPHRRRTIRANPRSLIPVALRRLTILSLATACFPA